VRRRVGLSGRREKGEETKGSGGDNGVDGGHIERERGGDGAFIVGVGERRKGSVIAGSQIVKLKEKRVLLLWGWLEGGGKRF